MSYSKKGSSYISSLNSLSYNPAPLCAKDMYSLDPWRSLAQSYWFDACHRSQVIEETSHFSSLPPHFIDRHAYLLYRSEISNDGLFEQDRITLSPEFDQARSRWLDNISQRRTGVLSLNLSPPGLMMNTSESLWLDRQLKAWREQLLRGGVDIPDGAFNLNTITWFEFYQRSAHYPMRGPAIWGPSFYDRLSDEGLRLFKMKATVDQIWDHYQLLLQVHEESHLIQRGEPMLAEVMLAWQWCLFLTNQDMWYWQETRPNGVSFNLEKTYVSRIMLTEQEAGLLFQDQQLGVSSIFADSRAYKVFCEGAWIFDHKYMPYKYYLEFIVWCFNKRNSLDLWDEAQEEWFIHADHD